MRGRTTIIIAHRLSTIALAERIVVLDAGSIDADGDHESLLVENAIYREIHEHGLVDRTFVDLDGDRVLTKVDEDDERAIAAAARERRGRLG
jgi:energy-coupling factor transporter ATP-binding protein EcfA2